MLVNDTKQQGVYSQHPSRPKGTWLLEVPGKELRGLATCKVATVLALYSECEIGSPSYMASSQESQAPQQGTQTVIFSYTQGHQVYGHCLCPVGTLRYGM